MAGGVVGAAVVGAAVVGADVVGRAQRWRERTAESRRPPVDSWWFAAQTAAVISPVPRYGDVVVGRDARGRVLRIGSHPGRNRVVLSIWQDGTCLATVRLAGEDLPEVLRSLSQSLVDLDEASRADRGAGRRAAG